MILPLVLAAVAFVTLLLIISPLLRGSRGMPARQQYDQAVYRDQLRELDRDVARGLLSDTDAQGARLEIQRRLLTADAMPDRTERLAPSPVMAGVVAVVVAGGAIGLYLTIGAPMLPDMPFASRNLPAGTQQAEAGHADLERAAAGLEAKLRANPKDMNGWLLYARTAALLNQWDKAANAYRQAMALGAQGPDVDAGYGEMLVLQARGIVTPAAADAFSRALRDDPKSDVARYYLALAAGQAGEEQKAIDMLQGVLADIPQDSPMREQIARRIHDAAKAGGLAMPVLARGKPPEAAAAAPPGPDAQQMANVAGMSDADRKAMISGMVAKLAAQMQADPGNLDGWMRLGHAYAVLGERDKAGDAYAHAAALRPGDVEMRLQAVQSLLEGLTPSVPVPAEAVTLLGQVQAVAPDQPELLWYKGLIAARDAHPDQARQYWSRLLSQLPAGGEDSKLIRAAMDALKGGAENVR
jgi:cytochrome c-type biogenesis protein CcmH